MLRLRCRNARQIGAYFFIRLALAWETTLQWQTQAYRHWLVMRPDAELLKPLPLMKTCVSYPGFNVISGSLRRDFYFHDRDWDWAYLVCEPAALAFWIGYWLQYTHDYTGANAVSAAWIEPSRILVRSAVRRSEKCGEEE